VFSHSVTVNNFSHLSAHTYSGFCTIGEGCCVGISTTMLGTQENIVEIPQYCNIMMNSTINRSLPGTGTYFNKKKISSRSSLEHKLF
jgi:hypothetical protein